MTIEIETENKVHNELLYKLSTLRYNYKLIFVGEADAHILTKANLLLYTVSRLASMLCWLYAHISLVC